MKSYVTSSVSAMALIKPARSAASAELSSEEGTVVTMLVGCSPAAGNLHLHSKAPTASFLNVTRVKATVMKLAS